MKSTNTETPILSVIVTTYKDLDLAERCIQSVIDSVQTSSEIIISDSVTTPEKESRLKSFQKKFGPVITKVILNSKNIGYPKAVNAGIQHTRGNILLVMNSDILVHDNAIQKMVDFLREKNDIGILAPKLLNIDGSTMASTYRFYQWYTIILRRTAFGKLPWAKKHLTKFLMLDWDHSHERDVDWVQGSAMMLKKSTIDKIGKMDSNIFLYFEDVDWCRRSWEHNLRVTYYPYAVMTHHHRRESAAKKGILSAITSPMTRIHIKSALYYIKKNWRHPFPKDHNELQRSQ